MSLYIFLVASPRPLLVVMSIAIATTRPRSWSRSRSRSTLSRGFLVARVLSAIRRVGRSANSAGSVSSATRLRRAELRRNKNAKCSQRNIKFAESEKLIAVSQRIYSAKYFLSSKLYKCVKHSDSQMIFSHFSEYILEYGNILYRVCLRLEFREFTCHFWNYNNGSNNFPKQFPN